MGKAQAPTWEVSGEHLESSLALRDRDLGLLRNSHELHLGGADIERGALRVRIGRRPIAMNIAALYRKRGRPVPDEYNIYEGYNIWLLNHSVGILRGRGALDASHVHYEIEFNDERAIITEVLPQPKFLRAGPGGPRCEAEIRLNGRAVPSPDDDADPAPAENIFFGAELNPFVGDEVVGRVSFPVLTPHLQAAGAGDAVGQWILERAGEPFSGDQSLMELVLLDRHIRRLSCRVRVSASVTSFFGFPLKMRGDWAPMDVELV
ncbi:MAG: hypothetical protein ABSH50_32125 [Bryobacteraceae bacterium]